MVTAAFLGSPGAGKTYTLSRVYDRLAQKGDHFFVQRGCPDGEGEWTTACGSRGKELARSHKKRFTESFVNWVISSTVGITRSKKLVLLDLGGIPSKENEKIIRETGVSQVVFVGEMSAAWRSFLHEVGISNVLTVPARRGDDKSVQDRILDFLLPHRR